MKLNWGLGIAIVYIGFVAFMVSFVVSSAKDKNELVTENYYDEAVRFQDRIDEANNAVTASTKVDIRYLAESGSLQVTAIGENKNLSGKICFYKPDQSSKDFSKGFSTGESGTQTIPLNNIAHGQWKVSFTYEVSGKKCLGKKIIFVR